MYGSSGPTAGPSHEVRDDLDGKGAAFGACAVRPTLPRPGHRNQRPPAVAVT